MSVLDPPPFDPLDGPGAVRVDIAGLGMIDDVGLADDQVLVDAVRAMEAAQRRLDAMRLAVVGELDARGEPITRTGLPTPAWLGSEFGLPRPAATRAVTTARMLRRSLHVVADALAGGVITFDHAALLARLCTPRVEPIVVELQERFVELAHGVRFEQWAREVRALIDLADTDGAEPDASNARLAMSDGLCGELHLDVDLVGDGAASVRAALLEEVDRRFRAHQRDKEAVDGQAADVLLGLPGRRQLLAEALVEIVRRGTAVRPGVPAPVTDVTVVVYASDPLVAFTPDGVRLADGTVRRLACDATFHALIVDADGVPLDLRRGARFASKDQRRAAMVRDGGCVHPGCDAPPAWVQLHHVIEWGDDGFTDMVNLASGCPTHHSLWHSTGWNIRADDDGPGQGFLITTPDGTVLRSQQHGRPRPTARREDRAA
jgi:hypothetical protein